MLLLLSSLAQAMTVQVEVDPLPYAMRGFAGHARVALPDSPWTLGAGVYSMNLPGPMVELAPDNRGEDWSARIKPSVGLFVDRYAQTAAEGRHLGVQLAWHRWQVEREGESGAFSSVLLMPRIGHVWAPFEQLGLYLDPWLGVGGTLPLGATPELAEESYQHFPLMVFGALHVGWRFG